MGFGGKGRCAAGDHHEWQVQECGAGLGGSPAQGPHILSPKSDRTYQVRLTGVDDGLLNLQAAADGAHDQLYWFVDSAYLGTSAGSSPLQWKPQAGRHIIRAVDENGRADSRVVTVRSVE